jgi:hypothetical protein
MMLGGWHRRHFWERLAAVVRWVTTHSRLAEALKEGVLGPKRLARSSSCQVNRSSRSINATSSIRK